MPKVLQLLRQHLGLRQVEAAMLLGVTQSNVSKMERRNLTKLATLRALATAKGKRLVLVVQDDSGVECLRIPL